jgi:membrane-associated protease RseP (regulator of RpoE activity)
MWIRVRSAVLLAVSVLAVQVGVVTAQDMPAPEGEPVDATEIQEERRNVSEQVEVTTPGGLRERRTIQRQIITPRPGYRSPTLGGEFRAEWMYILQNGQMTTFWGARILTLRPDSPMLQLGVRPGDVITRLDGIPIWKRMFRRDDGPWQLVELERHYGATEVRYIRQGTHRVRVGQVILDSADWQDGEEVSPLAP